MNEDIDKLFGVAGYGILSGVAACFLFFIGYSFAAGFMACCSANALRELWRAVYLEMRS